MRSGLPLAPLIVLAVMTTAVLLVFSVPQWLAAVPVIFLGAVATTRYPVAAMLVMFVLTGAIGTLTAFTSIRVVAVADFLLVTLWLGVIGSYVFTEPARRPWLWPGLIAAGLYILVSAFQILLADPVDLGFYSFRATAWYMLAFVLAALAPWPAHVLPRLAKTITLVALVVGAYCVFRWATEVNADEYAAQRAAAPRLDDRFAGSFLSANQLSGWAGTVIPFCLALTLAWRGHWRLVSLGALGLLVIALLASDVRAGVAAAAVGVLVVMLVHQLAPAFPGRIGVGLLAIAIIAAIGAGGYAVAVEGSAREERLESLLDPGNDVTYVERLRRWEVALEVIEANPLGLGLGTVGEVAARRNVAGSAVSTDLDSSYLKIALEQGVAVFILFALSLLGIAIGLFTRAVRVHDRLQASLAIGALGTLASLMVLFYSGLYIEGMTTVVAWLLIGIGAAAVTMHDTAPPREQAGFRAEA